MGDIIKRTFIDEDGTVFIHIYDFDEAERRRNQARKEFIAHEKALNNLIEKATKEKEALIAENQALAADHQALVAERQAMTTEKQSMAAEIERLRAQLTEAEKK